MTDVDVTIKVIDQTRAGLDSSQRNLGKWTDTAKKVGASMAALAAGAVAAGVAIHKAFEFSQEGAQLQRLEDSFKEVADQAGGSSERILYALQKASLGTVSNNDIILSSNRAMMLGLGADADKLAELMQVAAFRGRAMGLSTTQAFNDIVTGVGRASPMILDNLGIVVNAADTNEKYAESIGKTASELTKQEKTQALLNAVLEEGNRQVEAAGGLAVDTAAKYEKLEAQSENLFNLWKKQSGEALEPVVEWLGDALEASNNYELAIQRSGLTYEEFTQAAKDAGMSVNAYTEEVLSSSDAAEGSVEAMEAQMQAAEDLTDAYKDQLSLIGKMQSAEDSFQDNAERINEERIELEQKRADAIAQGWHTGSQKVQEYDRALEENSRKAQENQADHEKANREIILGLLERKFVADGILTDDEFNWLLEKGQAWGIYSDTVIQEAREAIREVDAVAASVNRIPTHKHINITSSYTPPYIPNQYRFGGFRQHGGETYRGESYIVGERGPELFTPNTGGTITPNHELGSGEGIKEVISLLRIIASQDNGMSEMILAMRDQNLRQAQ